MKGERGQFVVGESEFEEMSCDKSGSRQQKKKL